MPCIIPSCSSCKNYIGNDVCRAFPKGIPKEYMWGPVDVEELIECKNGYKFEDKYKHLLPSD